MAQVVSVDNILRPKDATPQYIPPGATLNQCWDILNGDDEIRPMVRAYHRGVIQDDWSTVTREGEVVVFAMLPAGGGGDNKQILGLVATVAILALAIYGGPLAAEALGFAAEGFAASAITAGIGVVGNLAVGALFKPPVSGLNGPTEANLDSPASPSPMIVGQSNQARPFAVLPVLFGTHELYPDLAAQPYVEKNGCKQTLHAIYCIGFGKTNAPFNMKLGGIPWDDLARENPSMRWRHVNLVSGPYVSPASFRGYEGVRDVNQVNIELKDKDAANPDQNKETVIPKSGAKKVYLDIIFPSGIFDINEQGDTLEYTVSLLVEKFAAGVWSNIDDDDLLNDTSVCVDEDDRPIATGDLSLGGTYDYDWAMLDKVIDSGYDRGNSIDFVKGSNIQCGEGSWKEGTLSGWNRGLAGNTSFPATCNTNNGRNATPFILTTSGSGGFTSRDPRWARVTNHTKNNGAIYFTFDHAAYNKINDGGQFAAGFYEFMLVVSNPSIYTDSRTQPTLVSNAKGKLTVNRLTSGGAVDNPGNGAPLLATRVGTINQNIETSFAGGFEIRTGKSFAGKMEVMFQFDILDNRDAASRKSCIKVESLLCRYTPFSTAPAVTTESGAELRIKVPILGGTIKNSRNPPRVGDSVMLGGLRASDCADCIPLGHDYHVGFDYDTEFGGSVPRIVSYIQKSGERFKITSVTLAPSSPDTSKNQHFAIYKIKIDAPWYYNKIDAIVISRLTGPGFHITSKFRGQIHFGLMLRSYAKYRISKNNLPTKLSVEKAVLASIHSINTGKAPVVAPLGVTYSLVEIAVPAHGQLGATLKPLSFEVARGLRNYDDKSYDTDKIHSDNSQSAVTEYAGSPAWSYMNVLLGFPGDRPAFRDDLRGGGKIADYIDVESFRKWADMCEDENFLTSHIVTGYTTVGDLLRLIASTGRARPTYRDGKHSIMFDGDPRYFTGKKENAKPIVRQMFTPENTFNGSASLTYLADVHGIKVQYTDKLKRQQVEFIEYLPGFDSTGSDYYNGGGKKWKAQKFESMSLPGVGYEKQASDLAQYYIKEVILRRERIVRTLDVENLISYEGDIVAVADDVMRLGGRPQRVKSVSAATGTVVLQLENSIPNVANLGIRIRYFNKYDNTPLLTAPLDAVRDPTGFNLQVTLPGRARCEVGYLVLWGEKTRLSKDYQIDNIKYNADMTATIEALEYYPDPLNYDGDRDPVGETPVIGKVSNPSFALGTVDFTSAPNGWNYTLYVRWAPVPDAIAYRVRFKNAARDSITSRFELRSRPLFTECGNDVEQEATIWAIDRYGNESSGLTVHLDGEVPVIDVPEVSGFVIVVDNLSSTLSWDVMELDYGVTPSYMIRHSPIKDGTATWDQADDVTGSPTQGNSISLPGVRSGTFMIKATEPCGMESPNAKVIISDVTESPEISASQRHTFFANGYGSSLVTLQNCKDIDGHRVCDLYKDKVQIGTTKDMEDLTGIVTQPGIGIMRGAGVALPDSGSSFSTRYCFKDEGWIYLDPDYGANAIQRGTEVLLSSHVWGVGGEMKDTLKNPNCPKMPTGVETGSKVYYRTWKGSTVPTGGWMPLGAGDKSIKEHFQLAIRSYSNHGHYSTQIAAGYFYIQYYKRMEFNDDVRCPAAGLKVKYERAFLPVTVGGTVMRSPAISIAGQDLRPGDFWEITSKDLTGFTIIFKSSSGTAKEATFDWLAEGFGEKTT